MHAPQPEPLLPAAPPRPGKHTHVYVRSALLLMLAMGAATHVARVGSHGGGRQKSCSVQYPVVADQLPVSRHVSVAFPTASNANAHV